MKTISQLKNKLWPLVSIYVRRRDADPHTGYVRCVTCGKVKHWKQGDAGHFIDGRHQAIVYDLRNIHFQCKPCNASFVNNKAIDGFEMNKEEVKRRYEAYMVKRYGKKVVAELRALDRTTKQWTTHELELLIFKFKKLCTSLDLQ